MADRVSLRGGRNAAARRSRTGLLCGVVAFALSQIALFVAYRAGPPRLRGDFGGRVLQLQRRLGARPAPRLVLMLGSSRTQFGLRAEELEGQLGREAGGPAVVANFGIAGAGPVTQLLTWNRLRREGIRPDLLLVEVLPAFLSESSRMEEAGSYRLPLERLREEDLPLVKRYCPARRPGLRREFGLAALAPSYLRRFALLDALSPGLVPLAFRDGGREYEKPVPTQIAAPPLTPQECVSFRVKAREEYADLLAHFRLGGRGCDGVRELLAACDRDGVPTAVVLMPEGPDFRSWYPREAYQAVGDWVRSQAAGHGMPLIDAREWVPAGEFFDDHHLLPAGAARFTERLGREGVEPLLRGLPPG